MAFDCSKCNECFGHVNIMVEGGVTYYFCDDCYDIAKDLTTNSLEVYVRKTSDYVENKIRKAKERREKGEGKWHKVVTKEHTCIWSDKYEENRKKSEDNKD